MTLDACLEKKIALSNCALQAEIKFSYKYKVCYNYIGFQKYTFRAPPPPQRSYYTMTKLNYDVTDRLQKILY